MKNLTMILTAALIGTAIASATTTSEKRINPNKGEMFLPQQDTKNIQSDEYKTYRAEQEKKITENDKKIAELKAKKEKVKKENLSKYESKIDELEKKNNELRKKIVSNYKDEGKEKWESFKKEFDHDMNELGQALKDLFKNNVKS